MSRKLLMEGILDDPSKGHDGCVMYPEVAYVIQPVMEGSVEKGKRAYFFIGKPNNLNESLDTTSVKIVENYDQLDLIERELPDSTKVKLPAGTMYVEGPYQRSDVKNANQRTYSRKLWERLIADQKSAVQQSVKERGMVGHLEHPADGRTHGKEVALLNTALKLREDGVVWGKSELLDTPNGHILQEFTRKGVRWGVSSRGSGTIRSDGNVNEEDFVLVTFDAVMNPSTPGAYPTPVKKVNDSTKEGSESPDTVSANVTEEVADFLSEASRLSEVNVDELTESERLDYAKELVVMFLKAGRSTGANVVSNEQRNAMSKWLAHKLRESTSDSHVDAVLTEAVDTAERDTEERTRAHVDSIRRRMVAAVEEAETERARSESLVEENEGLRSRLLTLETELAESETSRNDLETRLSLSEFLLAEQSQQEVEDKVGAVIDEAVTEVPELGEYRDLLERSDTPSEARSHIDRLITTIAERKRADVESNARSFPVVSRTSLPVGMLVESEGSAHKQTKSAPASHGAKLAAQALSAGTKKVPS
jgi:hypothetical protein